MAVAVIREFILSLPFSKTGVVFDRSLRLVNEIQDCYSTAASTEAVLKRRFDARLWVLDDLGTEQASDDAVRRITDILQAGAMRPTIITSNLAPASLEQRHPNYFRAVSRLGSAYFRAVRMTGRDRRFGVAS